MGTFICANKWEEGDSVKEGQVVEKYSVNRGDLRNCGDMMRRLLGGRPLGLLFELPHVWLAVEGRGLGWNIGR